jgi:hypothetical protein
VSARECYLGDPRKTYDNTTTKVCESGPITGCSRYEAYDPARATRSCEVCAKYFVLNDEGTCDFDFDGFEGFAQGFMWVVYAILAVGLPIIFFRCCCLQDGNQAALKAGLEHQTRCLPQDPLNGGRPYSVCKTDMHHDMVAGAGCCLYFNSLVFFGVVYTLAGIVTTFVYYHTNFDELDIHGKLQTCDLKNSVEVLTTAALLQVYQHASMWGMALLWLLLIIITLIHVWQQHKAFKDLDANHRQMGDFGGGLSGFPPDAMVDEITGYVKARSPEADLVGISLAYEYSHHADLIDCLLDLHIQDQDIKQELLEESDLVRGEESRGSAGQRHGVREGGAHESQGQRHGLRRLRIRAAASPIRRRVGR